ncbi:MAG: LptF/LptG family permease [Thermodesulfobacteriota bacterium]
MTLLNRYILLQFFRNFLILAAGFSAIYLLIDFFEKIDNFTGHGVPFPIITEFFLLNIPFIIDQLSPVLTLLAGVLTLGLLNHNNELLALKAGGLPLRAIITPILVGGLLCTIFALSAAQWVLPVTIAKTNSIWYQRVKGKLPLGIYRNGRYYYKGKDGFYSFARPWPKLAVYTAFSHSSWNEEYDLQTLVSSQKARWRKNHWVLHHGQVQERHGDRDYTTTLFKVRKFDFQETPENFFVPEYQSAELSLTGLYLDIHKKHNPVAELKAVNDFSSRISYIFLGLPLLLLGLPVLLISYKQWGKDLSIAIPASCGLAFVAWGLWGALQSLAQAAYLSPIIAAVTIHIVLAATGTIMLLRQDR